MINLSIHPLQTFINEAEKYNHKVDLVDLYKEKFDPVFDGRVPTMSF